MKVNKDSEISNLSGDWYLFSPYLKAYVANFVIKV